MREFYIVDMRPEWNNRPYISFWRPDNAGYSYPLEWSGKYDEKTVIKGYDYYTMIASDKIIRCAVECSIVRQKAVPVFQHKDQMLLVVRNTAPIRQALGKARLILPSELVAA